MPPRKKATPKLTPEQAQASILGTPGRGRKPVTHLSYSGGEKLTGGCPKQYELSYILGAPRKGAVWFLGGTAVHRATEEWDRAQVAGKAIDLPAVWRQVFNEELARAKESDPAILDWRKAGVKKERPNGEDIGHWYSILGPQLVQAYIAWRKRTPLEIWITPDGEPAIELDIGGTLPGMGEVEFKGFIDRVFYSPTQDQLTIVDLKTGTRKPETGLQLGVYAAAVQHRYGVPVPFGAAFMNRRGDLAECWPLGLYTPEYVGRRFRQIYDAIQAGFFPAVTGRHCDLCDVSTACHANNGPLAAEYDPDYPGSRPEF